MTSPARKVRNGSPTNGGARPYPPLRRERKKQRQAGLAAITIWSKTPKVSAFGFIARVFMAGKLRRRAGSYTASLRELFRETVNECLRRARCNDELLFPARRLASAGSGGARRRTGTDRHRHCRPQFLCRCGARLRRSETTKNKTLGRHAAGNNRRL